MKITEKIKKPIVQELKIFEKQFYTSVSSKVKLLDLILVYILNRKGKQIRPILVFLFAKMFSKGNISKKSYRAANLVELIHTASLIHDDIVDDSNVRRNFLTINALWKNRISVLVGDFFLSKALLLSTENKDYDLLNEVSKAVKEIAEGELFQIQKSRNFNLSEEDYIILISKKTASLFSCCCKLGSIASGKNNIDDVEIFGNYLGIIFQIKDDLFDYGDNKVGKPTGIDIVEKKMTLPLIYALNSSTKKERRSILRILQKDKKTKLEIQEVINFVEGKGGIDYAQSKMLEYKQKSIDILEKIPTKASTSYLLALINFVIERKK